MHRQIDSIPSLSGRPTVRRSASRVSLAAVLAVLLGVCLATDSPAVAQSAQRPNIVYILADDLGYRELGSFGQEKIKTPHLDRLAKQGMRLTSHYSGNAVCAPSRCVLMTGKHPGIAFVRNNRSVQPEGQYPIPDGEVTVAERLKELGYATGAFGKWGLGPVGSTGDPLKQGFDRFFGYNCQAHAHSYYPSYLWSDQEQIALQNDPPVSGHASLPGSSISRHWQRDIRRVATGRAQSAPVKAVIWPLQRHESAGPDPDRSSSPVSSPPVGAGWSGQESVQRRLRSWNRQVPRIRGDGSVDREPGTLPLSMHWHGHTPWSVPAFWPVPFVYDWRLQESSTAGKEFP